MKDKISNANDCPNYSSEEGCDCNYFKDCQYHKVSSAQPVKEREETVEQAAEIHLIRYYEKDQVPELLGMCVEQFTPHFIAGANWQKHQPVAHPASKSFKSAIDTLVEFTGADANYLHNRNRIIMAMHAFAAQHQKSEGMVEVGTLKNIISAIQSFTITGDVEPDEDLYNQGLERGVKEIEKVIRQLTQNDNENIKRLER